MRAINHVALNHQVVVQELAPVGVVGVNAAYFGRGQNHVIGLFGFVEGLHGLLAPQIELGRSAGNNVVVAFGIELAHQR